MNIRNSPNKCHYSYKKLYNYKKEKKKNTLHLSNRQRDYQNLRVVERAMTSLCRQGLWKFALTSVHRMQSEIILN